MGKSKKKRYYDVDWMKTLSDEQVHLLYLAFHREGIGWNESGVDKIEYIKHRKTWGRTLRSYFKDAFEKMDRAIEIENEVRKLGDHIIWREHCNECGHFIDNNYCPSCGTETHL